MHEYSWERSPSEKKKWTWRRFLYTALAVLFVLLLIGGSVAFTAVAIFTKKFEDIANGFDLNQVREMESASLLFDRNGKEFGKLFIQNRNPVDYTEISKNMVDAVISAEDNRFYEHKGVDWFGISRAMVENWRKGRISQGASTVTQQLARNSFDMRERTYQRKLIEMFLAWRIETRYSKREIMEMYLNRVYFGSGFYGVDAAARGYFGKSAKELGIGESAMLAGLLRSPQALSPWNNIKAATNIRDVVLNQMRDLGFISRQQLKEEVAAPLSVIPRTNLHRVSYSYDLIRQQVIAALGFEQAMNGGYQIGTTLDLDLQKSAEEAVLAQLEKIEQHPGYNHEKYAEYRKRHAKEESKIDQGDPSLRLPVPKYLQGALLALENSTGGILAMVGGRDFRHSEYNRALQAKRPAGTAITPLVYASAFDNNLPPNTRVDDSCIDNRYVMVGGATGILGEWGVERTENQYEGPMTARQALVAGKNAATVRLGLQLGLTKLRKTLADMGITSPLRDYSNTFLGSSEMTLDELTLAYTVFPNQGKRPKNIFIIQKIQDSNGTTVYDAKPKMEKAISGSAAYQTHLALEESLNTDPVIRSRDNLANFPAAGKNGSAYGFTDTYYIGYDSEITVGVWVGFDKPTKIYRGAFGRDLAMPVWSRFMNEAIEKIPPKAFKKSLEVEPVEICSVSGLLATAKCNRDLGDGAGSHSTTYIEYLTPSQKPKIVCDVHGGGLRNFAKNFQQDEWPRAASAIDLTKIRPVGVLAPTLIGFNDVYHSVQPGASRKNPGEIPVAKALPVQFADGSKAEAGNLGETSEGVPVANAIPIQSPGEREIRKAESKAGYTPLERPAIQLAQPPPTQF